MPFSDEELAAMFPQHVRSYLGVRLGKVLWSGRVNQGEFDVGEREIKYDGASGEPLLGQYRAPYLVLRDPPSDSVPGVMKGYVRIVSSTASSPTEGVFILEPNALQWEDDDVLQILDYVPLYSRLGIHDLWLGWHSHEPVPIMGPHRMGFVNEPLDFIGEDSYALKGKTITAHEWLFEGGIIVGQVQHPLNQTTLPGTRAAPIQVTWSAPGEYTAELRVRDSAGASYVSYRSVLIYRRTGANTPYDAFRFSNLEGSWESSGFTCGIEVYASPTLANFPDHALVVIISEEWYGAYKAALGDELGAENSIFVGYIVAGSQTLDAQTETVTLELATVDYLMDRLPCWGESFVNVSTESAWTEFINLTLADIGWHILQEHSTLKDIHDISLEVSDRINAMDLSEESTILDALNEDIFSIRFAKCAVSRLSHLHICQDRQFESVAKQNAHTIVLTVGRDKWLDTLDLGEERASDQVGQVELQAFIKELLPVISYAPALDPAYPAGATWGAFESMGEPILVEDVTEAEYLAGQALAMKNLRYSRLTVDLANRRALDPARQDYFKLNMAAGDTLRGHNWAGERLICRGMSWSSEPRVSIEGETLVRGIPGSCVALDPEAAPDQDLTYVVVLAQFLSGDIRAFFTGGFDEDDVYWTSFSTGLDRNVAYDLAWDPFNKYSVLYIGSYNSLFRWHAPLGSKAEKWSNVLPLSDFQTVIGVAVPWYAAVRVETSERKQGFVAIHAVYPHPGDPNYVQSRVLVSLDWGEDWSASDPFTFSGSSYQYYPGIYHMCLNDLAGSRQNDGVLFATVGMMKTTPWHSVLYRSTDWSTSFTQVGSEWFCSALADNKSAIHVPYSNNPDANILYWCYAEKALGSYPRLLKSINGGLNWQSILVPELLPQTLRQATMVDSHEKNHQRVIVYRSQQNGPSGFYLSVDGASNWVFRQICNGLPGSGAGQGLLTDVKLWTVDQQIVLAGGESFLRLSFDEGQNWVDKSGDLAEQLGAGFHILKILPYW